MTTLAIGTDKQAPVCVQVVASIHQPSGDITQLFDDVMLLSLGRMVYRGEWSCAAEFVDMLGYK